MLETIKGHVDFILSRHATYDPWGGGAMNGQTARLETCRQILRGFNISRIIETGTFRGATTEWFAQFGKPVVTIESHPRYATFSRLRLRRFPNVRVIEGDSVEALRTLLKDGGTTFFYLDAHWEHHLPLREELNLISRQCKSWIALVDDFEVPHDKGYNHDDYGPGKALTMEYLKTNGFGALSTFSPTTPSSDETGTGRGYVFLTANDGIAERLRGLPALTRASGLHSPSVIAARAPGAAHSTYNLGDRL